MTIQKKILAIGGGEIGYPGVKNETLKIDKTLLKLSGKKKPRLLFIPTASSDAPGYIDSVEKYFGNSLHCKVKTLLLDNKKINKKEIKEKIFNTDIVYVGGGNTLKMMNLWKKLGVDKFLSMAHKKGIVMSGLSAGSICWFKKGHSDSRKFKNKKASHVLVSGLGLIDAIHCPHFNVEKERQPDLKYRMKTQSGVAIAVDNCAAIEIIDDKFRVISSKKDAKAYKIYWKNNIYKKITLGNNKFMPLNELTSK